MAEKFGLRGSSGGVGRPGRSSSTGRGGGGMPAAQELEAGDGSSSNGVGHLPRGLGFRV
jgi:hypothetical protein